MKQFLAYLTFLLFFISCTSDDTRSYDYAGGVFASMPCYEFDDKDGGVTRVSLTAGDNGLSFAWTQGDKICVVGELDGEQQSTTHTAMTSSSGGSLRTSFNGGSFTLNRQSTYYSYYPYDNDTDDENERSISLKDQTQSGNGSTAHLGETNYMVAAKVTTDADASCLFHFTNVCCPCRFTLTLPSEANGKTVSALTVTRYNDNDLYFPTLITENFASLSAEDGETTKASGMTYTEVERNNFMSQSLTIDNGTIDSECKLVAWMMLFPKNHSTGRYHVTVKCSDGTVYAGNVGGKNMSAGKAYRFTATLAEWITMTSGVAYAVKNEGATQPYSIVAEQTYAELSDDVKSALPTEDQANALISGCDFIFGQGYDDSGYKTSGYYCRAKNNGESDAAGNVIFLPLTDSTNGDYWLNGGTKYLHIYEGSSPSIEDADAGGTTTAAIRLVKTN